MSPSSRLRQARYAAANLARHLDDLSEEAAELLDRADERAEERERLRIEIERLRTEAALGGEFVEAVRDIAGHMLLPQECLEWLREQAHRRAA